MEISIIVIGLILSAFFSGMEVAYISSNKIYLEIEKKQDSFFSRILTKLTEKPSRYIISMLIGKNIAMVIVVYYCREWMIKYNFCPEFHFSKGINLVVQILFSAFLILMASSFLPKVFFKIYANTLMRFLALPAYVFYLIFYYGASFVIWISDTIFRKISKIEGDLILPFFTKIELGNYITEQMNAVDTGKVIDSEIQIFQNALEFSGVKARDAMSPRAELAAVSIMSSVEEMKALFVETGYSKILVFQDSIDDIIGYVHSFELFKKPRTIKEVLISVEYVPQTIFIKEILDLLIKKRKSMAVVLDEYGGTAGIITIEDIVEELFGEIEDEHDSEENLLEEQIENGVFLLSSRWSVDYLNQTYQFNIPQSHSYTTLGGFIVDFTKEIPQKGANITIGSFYFTIEAASKKKIELVKMRLRD